MGRVLVVEDEFVVALELSRIVERAGYSVVGPAESVDATRKVLAQQMSVVRTFETDRVYVEERMRRIC